MVNNTHNSKLDETVKQTLSNYEAPFDAADWDKMENMLDAAPKSSTINFKWSYILYTFIGLAVLTGGYFLFNSISNAKHADKAIVTAPVEMNTNSVAASKINVPAKPITNPVVAAPVITVPEKTDVPVAAENNSTIKSTDAHLSAVADNTSKKETSTAEKTKNKKETPKATGEEFNPNQHILGMGNEPVFGDMLDSSKGIVNETKEKEETKKAAKIKNNTSIGWNALFPNVNADSLRSHREKMQKDSVKNN